MNVTAHNKQRMFLASTAPTVVFQGGARSGKTWAGALLALLNLLKYPGVSGMLVAPTYKMLRQGALPHLSSLALELGVSRHWKWNKSDGEILLPSGSLLMLRSASDPETLNGATLGWAVGDEVALWPELAFTTLQLRLSDPDGPRTIGLTFTPKGKNWAAEKLLIPRDGIEIIRAGTRDNPTLPEDYLERQDRELGVNSLIWRQEVLGEVVAWQGLVYPSFSFDKHVGKMPADAKIVSTIYGVDWGWQNAGVILCGHYCADGMLYIVEEAVHTEKDIDDWAEIGRDMLSRRGKGILHCDPSGKANIVYFRRRGLRGAESANNKVLPGITALGSRFNQSTILIDPECSSLISELHGYSYRQRQDGTTVNDEPVKANDHCCDALRYLNIGIIKPRQKQ